MTLRYTAAHIGGIARLFGALACAAVLAAVALLALPGGAHGAERTPTASVARTLSATDTAHLHYLRSSGSLLLEEGTASGSIPGSMHVELNLGAIFTGSFAIHTRTGTIDGHGRATPHGSGRYESFSGSLTVTGGSGLYTHARGSATLYGTFDRKTYALVVHTVGKLSY
jgi:hypothetical protein